MNQTCNTAKCGLDVSVPKIATRRRFSSQRLDYGQPQRGRTMPWSDFLAAHMSVLA